jgi:small-conductance mechanosensitive channel
MPWLDTIHFGNSIRAWLAAAVVAVVVLTVLYTLRRLVLRQLRALAARTATGLDDVLLDVLAGTRGVFLAFLALYAAVQVLTLAPPLERAVRFIGVIVIVLQIAIWGNRLISAIIARQTSRLVDADAATATTVVAVGFLARLAFWSILLLVALSNVGVNITGLVAGLGIGGIAIALAVQNVLSDLFASLSIVLDKPFVIGDFIIIGDMLGTVEYVGLKTTRVRSLSGEQLVFSNSDLLNSRIRNFKRMYHRRVVFTFGVTYQTTYEQAARIGALVREIVEAQDRTRFDRAHFKEYGDFALIYEVVYHVLDPDFNVYMDIQEAINLEIMRRFAALGIEFAYPTQTIHLESGQAERAG